MPHILLSLPAVLLSILALPALAMGPGGDKREFVEMPPMMRDHMLANMRSHLRALDEIFDALARDRAGEAAKIAEVKLGMSSIEGHGGHHMAPFMPEAMRNFGTGMHRAASRFARAVETADIEPSAKSQRALYAAFRDITANCTGCHEAFRLH